VLCGIFPIAQIREPYSCIQFIAEHIPIETIYALKKPADEPWSAFGICDAYAEKRGYLTKTGRTNTYRAGLEILNDVIDGKIEWYFDPETTKINLNVYTAGPTKPIGPTDQNTTSSTGSSEESENTETLQKKPETSESKVRKKKDPTKL